jgi:ribokinase
MAGKIVVVGSLNMDLVGCAPRLPVAGETITGHTFFDAPGGKGANQAYAAAKLGGRVAMVGRVGSDDFGRRMRANLEQVGCDVSGILSLQSCPSGIALIFVADDGHNSIMVLPGANGRLTGADIEGSHDQFEGAGYVLLQLESPLLTVIAAARAARRTGARVILDPAPAQPLPDQLFSLVDVLTPNETEATILTGSPPRRLDPVQASEIGRQLRSRGVSTVIVKLGDQGCALVAEAESHHISAPQVRAVDTTAAGDVFNAALAVGLSEGINLCAACQFANRAAALSVTRRGAQPAAPSRAEVDAGP